MSSRSTDAGSTVAVEAVNEVTLCGRLSSEPVSRQLPSGADIVTFRLVVARGPSPMTRGSKQPSDWVDCCVWGGRVKASAAAWAVGDHVEVSGALRRRFFRSALASGTGTRVEVEVTGGRVVRRAARR